MRIAHASPHSLWKLSLQTWRRFLLGNHLLKKAAENNGSLLLTTKAFPVLQRTWWNEIICLNEINIIMSLDKSPSLRKAALILSLRVQIYTWCSVWFTPGLSQEGSRPGGMSWVHLETCPSSARSPMATLLIYRHFKGNSWLIYQPIPCLSSKFNPKAAQFQQSCQYNVPCSAALLTFFDIMGSSLICNETLWINQCMLIHEVFNFLLRSPQ